MNEEYFKDKHEIEYLFNKLYDKVFRESNRTLGYDRDSMLIKNRLKELRMELEKAKEIIDKIIT